MIYEDAFLDGFRVDPDITFLEWADKYFYLPRESSAEHGKYRSDRTPMIKEILEELSPNSPTQQVVLMKPTQLAGTTAALIFMLAVTEIAPGPGLLIQPTGDLARAFSKKKFATSLAATINGSGHLKGKIRDEKSRDKDSSTILEKTFQGGSWRMAGSNSPAVYRSESVRYLILDDLDGFEMNIGGEGSPVELADRRTGTFANRKIFLNSTPTLKGLSLIETAYNASSQGRFFVPCPFCGEHQYLVFHNLKFTRDDDGRVIDAWYECVECRKRIDEHYKDQMLINGKYVHEYPEREVRGFTYNALVTPIGWVNTWQRIAQIFVDSKDSVERLQAFKNTILAEPFESAGDQPGWVSLYTRRELYTPLVIPDGAYVLTAGIDVQGDRLAVLILGWGEGEECWVVYWGEIFGNPALQDVWGQLDGLLSRSYTGSSIIEIVISMAAVDSGGHHTQYVYDYVRSHSPRVIAIKGLSTHNRPILGRPNTNAKETGGVDLYPIGTDTAKSLVYSRLRIKEPGPGYVHFHEGLDEDFFRQLTAERLITRFNKGYPVAEWRKIGPRNEALDCFVYAYSAALRAMIKEANWGKLKARLLKSSAVEIRRPTFKPPKYERPALW